jgi:hypothetical protein
MICHKSLSCKVELHFDLSCVEGMIHKLINLNMMDALLDFMYPTRIQML